MLRSLFRSVRARAIAAALLVCSLPIALATASVPERPSGLDAADPITLFAFEAPADTEWSVVNDGVMGGRSKGFVTVAEGTLRFTGTLVTRGGGFTSIRARREADLSGYDGIELRVRGGGRPFELAVDDGMRGYGRTVSRRAAFPTTSEWTVVRIPFDTLRSTIFGQGVDAPALDRSRVRGLGIFIADEQDGPFELEVDWIQAYRASGKQAG